MDLQTVNQNPNTIRRTSAIHPTHSSKTMWNSEELSKTSWRQMIRGCSLASLACRMISISSKMSSRQDFPRRRFFSTFTANGSPVDFSVHFFTMANLPLEINGTHEDDKTGIDVLKRLPLPRSSLSPSPPYQDLVAVIDLFVSVCTIDYSII